MAPFKLEEFVTPCDYARIRHKNLFMWRKLWTGLIFAFGCAVIIFLIGAIFLFIRESWLPGILSTFGTIVNGAGTIWVRARRVEAVEEEKEAFNEFKEMCKEYRSLIEKIDKERKRILVI
jgi:hypothetical protein